MQPDSSDPWSSLADSLGVSPSAEPQPPEAAKPPQPRPQPPRQQSKPVSKPASPGGWSSLATELGLDPGEPETSRPVQPPPRVAPPRAAPPPRAESPRLEQINGNAERRQDVSRAQAETAAGGPRDAEQGTRNRESRDEPREGEERGRRRRGRRGGRRRSGAGREGGHRLREQRTAAEAPYADAYAETRAAEDVGPDDDAAFHEAVGVGDDRRSPEGRPPEEGRAGDESGEPRRPRRRRGRRGGRGRRSSGEQAATDGTAPRGGDANLDGDEPLPSGYGMPPANRERPAREPASPSDDRGRRRRRRGGRRRERGSEDRPSSRFRGARTDFAPVAGSFEEDDEGLEFLGLDEGGEKPAKPRRDIQSDDEDVLAESGLAEVLDVPSWVEAIGIVIAGNLDARSRSGRDDRGHRG